MSDLEEFRPGKHEELAADALHISLSALDLIPIVGTAAARALEHNVNRRAAERDRQFRVSLIEEIVSLHERLDAAPTVDELIDSDRFIATVNACSRAASETTSETKRARLARAAATAVVPSTFTAAEIESNLRYVEQYSDLHVWLLGFYCDPAGWLRANGMGDAAHELIYGGRRDEPLDAALGGKWPGSAVQDAIEDLQRDMMLGSFSLDESVGDRKQFSAQTRGRGRRFLEFLREDAETVTMPDAP